MFAQFAIEHCEQFLLMFAQLLGLQSNMRAISAYVCSVAQFAIEHCELMLE